MTEKDEHTPLDDTQTQSLSTAAVADATEKKTTEKDEQMTTPLDDAQTQSFATETLVNTKEKVAPVATPPTRGGKGLAAFALLIALVGAGGSGYVWYQWQQDNKALDARLRKAFAEELKTLEGQLQAQRSAADTLRGQAESQSKDAQSLHDSLNSLQTAIKSLQGDITTLKGEVDIHKGGVDIQKTDTQNLIAQVHALQTDIQNLQTHYQTLKGGVDTTVTFKSSIQALQEQTQSLTASLQALKEQADGIAQKHQKNLAEVDNRVENLQLNQRHLLTTLDNIRAIAARGGDVNAYALSEVEYLLHMADDKLKLQRDAAGALEALQVANARLATVDESAFMGTRKIIEENIANLRGITLGTKDRTALARKIVELEQRLDKLPLRATAELAKLKEKVKPKSGGEIPVEPDGGWWQRAGSVVWGQLKDIVVVRNERSRGLPVMAPKEEYFLMQNLKLELEVMRMALLAGDAASYQQSDELARQWVETYFDANDKQVAEVLTELKTLQAASINPNLPDLSTTLGAFREIMERRGPMRSLNSPAGDGAKGAVQ